ncbi:MAG: 3-deoxy-manno-octulosonate cytidylyltransferase [Sedimentisphaerales bacterium]|nr:3-deoxy-manno-octulosonate cytidylyltransferase [Sedimentisphaerales bacterium]
MKVIAVIPARYSSTRLAGKVLANQTGKFLIQHTYEQACKAKLPEKVIIATDDEKIVAAAKSFGADCVLTSVEHKSGTDRIAEAVQKLAESGQRTANRKTLNAKRYSLNADDIVINIQGDEPEIDPAYIDKVAQLLIDNTDYPMSTLAAPIKNVEQVVNPNIVKVITDSSGKAIYFSRHPIPYDRESGGIGDLKQYLRHLGIYAYRKDFLLKITKLPQTPLEKIEKLEQLRAIENGYGILVGKVEHTTDGIDTPEQYAEFVKRYKKRSK